MTTAQVKKKIAELSENLAEVEEARVNYLSAVATAKKCSEELSTLLNQIIQQTQVTNSDYEVAS